MTLRITTTNADATARRGFTLLELILVMALLLVITALTAPQLSAFFRGRTLDSEARRFLTLTRYAQSRAVAEGVPMVLWMDTEQRTYGLEIQAGYAQTDDKAVSYELGRDLNLQVEVSATQPVGNWELSKQDSISRVYGEMPAILFTPEGFVSQASPEAVSIVQLENQTVKDSVRIAMGRTRLNYEIQSPNLTAQR